MKEMPLELVYRLYKAEIGDVIDNTYVRLTGAWKTDDDREVSSISGFLERIDIYQFVFKDLTDGSFYRASNSPKKGNDPSRTATCLYEPFTIGTCDPFPVFQCRYEAEAINSMYMIEDVWG